MPTTSGPHPNEELLRAAYEAFSRGDLATIASVLDPDVAWHLPGDGPLGGDHRGRDAVLRLLARLGELTGGSLRQQVHDVLAGDDHGIVLVDEQVERDGVHVELRLVHILHLSRARITEFWEAPADLAAYAKVFGGVGSGAVAERRCG